MNKTIYWYKIRTTNAGYQSAHDMQKLWEKFMSHNPEMSNKIYVVYTNYENKDQGFYDVYIWLEENFLYFSEKININIDKFLEFESEYYSPDDIMKIWKDIWEDSSLNRRYSYDVEEYDFVNNSVKIYLSIK